MRRLDRLQCILVMMLAGMAIVGVMPAVAAPPSGHPGASPILALIRSRGHVVVARVDAATLKRVHGAQTSAPLGGSFELRWTYSPDGHALALAGTSVWGVDAHTLQTHRWGQPDVDRNAIVWLPSGRYQTDGNLFGDLDTKGQLEDWGVGRYFAALLLTGQTNDQPSTSTWFALQLWPQPSVGAQGADLPAFAGKPGGAVALAVSEATNRVYVIAGDGTAATMNLKPPWALTASTVALPASFAAPPAGTAALHARWVNSTTVSVVGLAGLALVDLHSQTARLLDASATNASVGKAGIVGWNPAGGGLAFYTGDGTLRFHALAGQRINAVVVGDRYVYACAGRDVWACRGTTFVLDARTGAITARVTTPIVPLVRGSERDGH